MSKIKIFKFILLLFQYIIITSCVSEIQKPMSDQHGCTPPDISTFTKLGIDINFAKSTFGKVVTGDINIKSNPEIIDLIGKAARENSMNDYLRCLALNRDKYTKEQAIYLQMFYAFTKTSPTADEFTDWQKNNPFPKKITKIIREIEACKLNITAEWVGLEAPEITKQCSYHAPENCIITNYRTVEHSNNNGEYNISISNDNKSINATAKAKPHGSVVDRRRGWIEITVFATLECSNEE